MDILQPTDWTFPVPIHYGPGRVTEIAAICQRAKIRNPLIVTDRGSRNLPFIAQVMDALKAQKISHEVFFDISPNPTDVEILQGKQVFDGQKHDAVIALGGGSAMDGGKAISLIAGHDEPLWSFEYDLAAEPEVSLLPATDLRPNNGGYRCRNRKHCNGDRHGAGH